MLDMFDWTKLSGTWDVEIREEGAKTRKEQRLLTFCDSGSITGTGSADCVSLDGNATGLNMEWLEVYPWGSMHVTAKYKVKTKRLHGTFKASDGGKGRIDMFHRLE